MTKSVIKSFSVGFGDMFYIDHDTDNFTVIDCCIQDGMSCIVDEIASKVKGVTRFISTHPDEDHLLGLKQFYEKGLMYNFYCVKNKAIKEDETEDFKYYCKMRDGTSSYYVSKGCKRKWLNDGDDTRGSAGINFLWPDLENEDFKSALSLVAKGEGFNNISPIFTCSVGEKPLAMWMGDIEHDFLEKVKDNICWPNVDILFAPHHGRRSGKVPDDVLNKINPKVVVIGEAPSKYLNYYNKFNTITQNSAGDIVFVKEGYVVHVYVSNPRYKVSFLDNYGCDDVSYGCYIGSFISK